MTNANFATAGISFANTITSVNGLVPATFSYGAVSHHTAITQPHSANSGLNIHVIYDSSVSSCPDEKAFKACVAGVVKYYESQFSDPITITIHVGWGEVHGDHIGAYDGAESESNYTAQKFTYADIKAAMRADATSDDDLTALASLGSDPTHGGKFSMTTAEAKALGLVANNTSTDGWTGVDKKTHWVFNTTNTSGSNVHGSQADMFSFLAHEFSEIMGRQMDFGEKSGNGVAGWGYYPEDLFDYTADGVRSFKGSQSGRYFSLDGGHSVIHYINSNHNGDLFDWKPGSTPDSFDWEGSKGKVSAGDLRVMDVLGYDRIGASGKSIASTHPDVNADSSHVAAHYPVDGVVEPQSGRHIMIIDSQGLAGYQAHGELLALHSTMHLASDQMI